jgi:HSP20 family protein
MTLVKSSSNKLFPSFFDDFLSRDIFNWGNADFFSPTRQSPAVNLKETAGHYEVELAVPGLKKEDLKVQLNGNTLTISCEKAEAEEQDARFISREFHYGSFTRTFQLQKDVVNTEEIDAKLEEGVLKLRIPKTEKARQQEGKLIAIA